MAYHIRNAFYGDTYGFLPHLNEYINIAVLALIVPIFISAFRSYEKLLEDRYIIMVLRIVLAIFISIIMISAILFITSNFLSRLFVGIFGCTELFMLIVERTVLKVLMHFYSKNAVHRKNVLIIGCGKVGKLYKERVAENTHLFINVIGFIALNKSQMDTANNKDIIGTIDDLASIVKQYNVIEAVIALPAQEYSHIKSIISLCDNEGLRVRVLPAYYEFLDLDMRVEYMSGIPVINIRNVPLDSIKNRFLKRTFDIFASLLAIILLSPVYVLLALGVKLTSPGPILFKQERVSAGNRPFMMLKFRSMCVQKKEEEKTKWTTPNDSRVTKFGAFIRKTSLDELPQFFNVLKGDMSIIGPRPERPYWVEKFKEEVPDYMIRHYIKTGITGWAQVNGFRGDTSIEERINCDIFYIRNWSISMDMKIVFMTIIETLVKKNAY